MSYIISSRHRRLIRAGKPQCRAIQDFVLLGELSLDGSLRPVRGVLSMATDMDRQGIYGMIVPGDNAREAAIADGPIPPEGGRFPDLASADCPRSLWGRTGIP